MVKINEPNFMCIGAAKSATTSLFEMLRQHPLISAPSFKEPHFFDNSKNYQKGKQWYLKSYFTNIESAQVIGEFTPSYLSSLASPKRILETFGPKIKFVAILRNPIDRAYSHYLHTKRDEHEALEFLDAVLNENDRLTQFNKIEDELSFSRFSYIYQGQYAQHINNYLNYFSIKQFHFVLFNDFINKREETIQSILSFLGIDNNYELDINITSNKSSIARSKSLKRFIKNDSIIKRAAKWIIPSLVFRQKIRNLIHASNNKTQAKTPLSEDERKLVYDKFFEQEIIMLEKILNLNLNHWKEC